MAAARNDLAALQAEIQHEELQRSAAIGRLSDMVSEDLATSDPAFHQLEQQIILLETASRRAKDDRKIFEDMQKNVKDMLNHAEKRDAIPEKRNQLVDERRQLQHDEDDAQRQQSGANDTLSQLAASFDRATERSRGGVKCTATIGVDYDHARSLLNLGEDPDEVCVAPLPNSETTSGEPNAAPASLRSL
ncbi:MAG: hypothetical protein ABGZ53_09495 [Fuerstiella sp.]